VKLIRALFVFSLLTVHMVTLRKLLGGQILAKHTLGPGAIRNLLTLASFFRKKLFQIYSLVRRRDAWADPLMTWAGMSRLKILLCPPVRPSFISSAPSSLYSDQNLWITLTKKNAKSPFEIYVLWLYGHDFNIILFGCYLLNCVFITDFAALYWRGNIYIAIMT